MTNERKWVYATSAKARDELMDKGFSYIGVTSNANFDILYMFSADTDNDEEIYSKIADLSDVFIYEAVFF